MCSFSGTTGSMSVGDTFMGDLAQVDTVLEQLVQGSARDRQATRGPSGATDPLFASDSLLLQALPQLRDRSGFYIYRR